MNLWPYELITYILEFTYDASSDPEGQSKAKLQNLSACRHCPLLHGFCPDVQGLMVVVGVVTGPSGCKLPPLTQSGVKLVSSSDISPWAGG